MVKDHLDSERGYPPPSYELLFPISSKGSFICTIPDIYIYIWRRMVPKSGRAHRHVIYVPSVMNQYKRVVFGCMVIY